MGKVVEPREKLREGMKGPQREKGQRIVGRGRQVFGRTWFHVTLKSKKRAAGFLFLTRKDQDNKEKMWGEGWANRIRA